MQKQKIVSKTKSVALYSSLFFVLAIILNIGLIKAYYFAEEKAQELIPAYSSYAVSATRKAQADELPMKEWITQEFKQAGINTDVADCVLWGESNYNVNSVNTKSLDFGIAQWNIMHIKSGFISLECAGSYRCSIEKMIEKVKSDKGFSGWNAYKNNNCKRFGATFMK